MLCALAVGLASGVGLYALGVFSTVFLVVAARRHRVVREGREEVRSHSQGRRPDRRTAAEDREPFCAASSSSTSCARRPTTELCYDVTVPLELDRDRVTDAILRLDPEGHAAVDWSEKKNKAKYDRETDHPARRRPHAAAAGRQAREALHRHRHLPLRSAGAGEGARRRGGARRHGSCAHRAHQSRRREEPAGSSSCGCSAPASSWRAPPTT